ncbi:MAG: (2Fe-2S)-binding protein [Firmicutes bacterium]|nr:(2Fe-2S)-binding protein [Alicyclobacillaceae bacterium]MCL6497880.1 (2Fe-2S)-binding protein [Bacillota bacterium]
MNRGVSVAARPVTVTVDGQAVEVPEGSTVREACAKAGVEIPTLCFLENLTPVNVCRVCVVELEGSRALVPSCSRKVEGGMVIHTDTPRVRTSRKMVLELLASSVDLSAAGPEVAEWLAAYGAEPERYGRRAPARTARPDLGEAATVAQPPKVDNALYVRDYSRCILCYKCVEACGEDAQFTFAIAVAGRGFDAHISTEFDVPLPDSACVYCGNCVGVCPTGALMFKSEFDLRQAGAWDPARQTVTPTICPYCGVGCTLELHVQDNRIVKVTSPLDHTVSHGHLCVKGRFGFEFVQDRDPGG